MNSRTVNLFFIEGTPFGLRYADYRNKTCKALVAPRNSLKQLLSREELEYAGIYFLIGADNETGETQVYIGEADVLKNRLPLHNKKDFWNEVVVFTTKDNSLDKALVRYLENALYEKINQAKLCQLINKQNPTKKNISESDQSLMDEFTNDISFLLHVLGYKVTRSTKTQISDSSPILYTSAVGVNAKGRDTDEGFIVYQGSTARIEETNSIGQNLNNKRSNLIVSGVLNKIDDIYFEFTQDYVFTSPSTAAGVILGRSSNGRIEWKTKKGKTLKEIQEEKIK